MRSSALRAEGLRQSHRRALSASMSSTTERSLDTTATELSIIHPHGGIRQAVSSGLTSKSVSSLSENGERRRYMTQ
jgi:hypothetical protein